MEYMSTIEASKKWNINERRVRVFCNEGRIFNAVKIGKNWRIPINASKPTTTSEFEICNEYNLKVTDEECGNGLFGELGGCYMPGSFKATIEKVLLKFKTLFNSSSFLNNLKTISEDVILSPTPISYFEKFSSSLNDLHLYGKREDLNNCGSIYINQTLPMALLAKETGKKVILAEMGDENFAIAVAFAAKYVGLKAKIYISYEDMQKQKNVVQKIQLLGAEPFIICEDNGSLYNATNECFRDYLLDPDDYFYAFHDAVGPHPYPIMASKFLERVGHVAKKQFYEKLEKLPTYIIAPIQIASNALAIIKPFIYDKVKIILVDSPFTDKKTGETKYISKHGEVGCIHGCNTKTLADYRTGEFDYESLVPGCNYPSINPELWRLVERKRVSVLKVQNDEIIEALFNFATTESIIPSLEDAITLAGVIKLSKMKTSGSVLMCLTGSGKKDIDFLYSKYKNCF